MQRCFFEVMCRRVQLLERSHLQNPLAPDYSGAAHLLGVQGRRGGALVSPLLNSYVATKLRKEGAVSKERRKVLQDRSDSRVLICAKGPHRTAAAKAEQPAAASK